MKIRHIAKMKSNPVEEKDINAMCDKGRILILRKSRKYSRLNQKDLLVLIDSKDKK